MKASALILAAAAISLAGCEVVGIVGGALAGAATGAATNSGAAGIATAIVVQTGVERVMRVSARHAVTAEQDAIAATAGEMQVGETRAWEMQHKVTRRKAHGHVRVTRLIKTPLATCKELLFSIADDDDKASWFTTSACQQGDKWKWAAAEPAVERWGNLQ